MRAVQLYRSNRLEVLVERLAELCAAPVGGPLDDEWIVIPGRGMEVWLRTELARRHGVWTGGALLFPRRFVERVFYEVLGAESNEARGRLVWSVMRALGPDCDIERLRRFIAGDRTGKRRYQLARMVADTFDQYLIYRPEMLRAWEAGDDRDAIAHGEGWQPNLWRALAAGQDHTAALERHLLERLAERTPSLGALPTRLSVFGVSSLPPMYVRVLAALARHIDVHMFQLSPARGWWGDLADPRRRARAGNAADALHLTGDHPLLASCGKLGADLLTVMCDELEALEVAEVEPAGDLYREPDTTTMLGRLQADILSARPGTWPPPSASDTSLAFVACHAPMREVEVLHDRLLAMLSDEGFAPHEVLVLMSDVETYAPLVEAVFERDRSDSRFIPYRIADRSVRIDSPMLEALHRMLALVRSRATASQLLDLLALEPVRRKLGLLPEDVDALRGWVVEVGVRWGIDAEHRAEHGQPPAYENTWRFGLDRLLLGYAMPGGGVGMFGGVLPFDEIEGQVAALAGKLAAFAERIFRAVRELAAPRSLAGWRDTMLELCDDMLAEDPSSGGWEHERIRRALGELCAAAAAAGFDEPVELEVVRSLLDEHIDELHPARGFMGGGVTFSAMVPMRSIPFRVVCMLGMSDGAFPRARRPVDFDLMAKPGAARPGDRSRRADDRYLFLEALLSARERLVISYTGQSIRDGSRKAPAVVVGELSDYLAASHGLEGPLAEEDGLTALGPGLFTRHPLQPFSPRYFDASDARLFSYAHEYCAGARELAWKGQREPVRFFSARLPEPDDEARIVELAELVRFFEGPARYLMKARLGVDLREREHDVSDREPLELDHLERYHIGDRLLELFIAGFGAEDTRRLARASGALPLGTPGECDHDAVLESVEPIAARVPELRGGARVAPLYAELRLPDGTLLTGEIGDRYQRGIVRHQYARVSGKHLLAMWVRHLVACAAGELRESILVGRGARGDAAVVARRLSPVSDAASALVDLLELYRIGRSEPLLLFPRVSFELARLLARAASDSDLQGALYKLAPQWELEKKGDPHVARLFGVDIFELARAPTPGDFRGPGLVALARRVFDPMLVHLEEV